ncbi:MAG: sugar ABC transporter substrate-binding protein, partial [Lysobacterales bacterium]
LVFAGGGQEGGWVGGKPTYVVGHIVYTMEAQYHQGIAKQIVEYGKKMYNAKVIVLDAQGKDEVAMAAVENLIQQKVQAISLHYPNTGLTTNAIKMAREKGIPMVTTLIRPSERIAPHVQPQETQSSQMMGEVAATQWLKAHPGDTCRVFILDFGKFPQIEEMRTGAFLQGVKNVDPNAVLVGQLNGFSSTEKSMQITLDALQKEPKINIIFGGNDEMGLGALAACQQLGRGKMDNGVPLTEVIAGLDANISAMAQVYNPNSSFKLTHGAVRDNAIAEMDTMIGMITGKIDPKSYAETQVLSREFDYWNSTMDEAQRFLEVNYLFTGSLKDEVAKATR